MQVSIFQVKTNRGGGGGGGVQGELAPSLLYKLELFYVNILIKFTTVYITYFPVNN